MKIHSEKPVRLVLKTDTSRKYQTIQGIGASGAWWSQDVGGWRKLNHKGKEIREEIANLLFDRNHGIGLSTYRYNIGAGSAEKGAASLEITEPWRRTESFEREPGVYDWSKDEQARWFLDKAREYGVRYMTFFCNSPLERLTINGKAYGEKQKNGTTSNLSRENYRAFAEYVLDVAEYFVEKGYPVKAVSPVNEPQWEWTGKQEGCHFEPEELVDFYHVFLDVMEERKIQGVKLSAPELGEWGNTSYPYYEAILGDKRLRENLDSLDVHSYWSDENAKETFISWMKERKFQDMPVKTSEWCEMVQGRDYGMDSALHLALEMQQDFTRLNVLAWEYWIAVSCYQFRDGLLYVDPEEQRIEIPKRFWAMGHYSRFVRPGYRRVECVCEHTAVRVAAFTGIEDGKEQLVVVVINPDDVVGEIDAASFGTFQQGVIYVTDEERDLEPVHIERDSKIVIYPKAIHTILLIP